MGTRLDYAGVKYLWQRMLARFAKSEQGVPAGGSTGQVLAKTGSADYATNWTTLSSGNTTQLYSNSTGKGANSSLSLSSSAANFGFLDIIYTDGNRKYTSRLYEPNGKTFSLFRSVCNGTTIYQNTLMGSVSGTTVTLGAEAQATMGGSSIGTSSSTTLKVIKVLGGN